MHRVINFLSRYVANADNARTFLSVILILAAVTAALKSLQYEGKPLVRVLLLAVAISAFIAVLNVYAYPESATDGVAYADSESKESAK